jgi:hypothetical protein
MAELQKLTNMMMTTSQRIEKATKEIYNMARESAQSEYEYRKALAQEIAKLRTDGLPVTLVADMARGNCAELKLQRDMSENLYKSAIESMRALQTQLSGLQSVSRYQSDI